MSDTFGDYEPEDAWHPDDPPVDQLANLRARVALLISSSSDDDLVDELRVIAALVAIARMRRLVGRALVRADQLDEDIAYMRGRV